MHALADRPPAPGIDAGLHVIALGASAGGLEPLLDFFGAFPIGQGFAFIVVQHLARAQPSVLPTLLQARTQITMVEAAEGLSMDADHAYVITAGTELTVVDGLLHVVTKPADGPVGPADQIDRLFESLASACGQQAIGVILSGMGDDGSIGLRAILDAGGLGFAQLAESAQFDSMPRHAAAIDRAVSTSTPHLLPQQIIDAMARLASPPGEVTKPFKLLPQALPQSTALTQVIHRIAAITGHDFLPYKASTLLRRIERRMAIHHVATMTDYVRLLADSSQETELLFKELLIGVTSFFRDPTLWEAVSAVVLPGLVEAAMKRPDRALRAWVAACSTGEEAYSLAILLSEALDATPVPNRPVVQIFASDLNADAIQFARRGIYPASIAESMSPARLARFFVLENGFYRVTKPLRDMALFAHHNLVSDPPFMRLDLVSCRNLLIYFDARLQHRILPLFHYLLRPGGHLLLGNSETVGRDETFFAPLDPRWRIYRRKESVSGAATIFFPLRSPAMPSPPIENDPQDKPATPPPPNLQSLVGTLMLEEFSPPAVLVGEQGDILYVSGRTGRFLEPAAGKANWNIHAMARDGLRSELAAALRRVRAEGLAVELTDLTVEPDEGNRLTLDLTLRPMDLPDNGGVILIVFREHPAGAATAAELPATPKVKQHRSVQDTRLRLALDEAQALREEMRSSQEELQSSNEELQSTNEELQSANEELTASKEEMQAMNEELQTVNTELMSKLDDLSLAQSDLKNLLNSTQIATLFLDGEMNVRRFTERAKKVIKLRDSDVGRPLSDLTTTLEYPSLLEDIAGVLHTLEFSEKEIRTSDGLWYAVRIMPYRTQANVIDGSVITFADISVAKALEARLREATGGAEA